MQRRRGGQQYPNNNNNNNNTPIDIAISSQNSRDFNSKLQEILEKDASSIANISFFKLNGLINNWFKFDLRINEQLQMDMLNQLIKINFKEKPNNLASKKVKDLNTKVFIIYGASKVMTKIRNQRSIVSDDKKQLLLQLITLIFDSVNILVL